MEILIPIITNRTFLKDYQYSGLMHLNHLSKFIFKLGYIKLPITEMVYLLFQLPLSVTFLSRSHAIQGWGKIRNAFWNPIPAFSFFKFLESKMNIWIEIQEYGWFQESEKGLEDDIPDCENSMVLKVEKEKHRTCVMFKKISVTQVSSRSSQPFQDRYIYTHTTYHFLPPFYL